MTNLDHFNLAFDFHIFSEKLEEIKEREGRDATNEEILTAASESVMAKTSGKPQPIEGDDDRLYRSQLVVFEAIMTFQAKAATGTYDPQERARIADSIAKDAAAKIAQYWTPEE